MYSVVVSCVFVYCHVNIFSAKNEIKRFDTGATFFCISNMKPDMPYRDILSN